MSAVPLGSDSVRELAIVEQDVIGLDVAVDDPPLVGHGQPARDVGDDRQGGPLLEPRVRGQPGRAGSSPDVLQDEVVDAAVLVQLDVVDDVGLLIVARMRASL